MESDSESGQSKMDLFASIELGLKSQIPLPLKNLLIINGYDTRAGLLNISTSAIEAMEKFARTELHQIISVSEYKNFYGIAYQHYPDKFKIVEGHREMLFMIKNFLASKDKTFEDKSVMTDYGVNNNTELTSSFTSSSGLNKNILENTTDKEINHHNLTEENADILRVLKNWAKSKLSEEIWRDQNFDIKFNNIRFSTSLNSCNNLVCNITCFCQSHIKIFKLSKKTHTKPRWVLSNFHHHLQNLHFKSRSTSLMDLSLKRGLKQTREQVSSENVLVSQPKITTYIKPIAESTRESMTKKNADEQCTYNNKSNSNTINSNSERINVIQCLTMKAGHTEFFPTSTHMENRVENLDLDLGHNINSNSETQNIAPLVATEELEHPRFTTEAELQDISDQENDCPHSTTTKSTPSKWSTFRYSRSERNRRKRETIDKNQFLITNFISIKEQIETMTRETPELLNDLNNASLYLNDINIGGASSAELSKSGSKPLSNFLQILIDSANKNLKDNKISCKSNLFKDDLKKFALYLFYAGGRLLYETLHSNLNNVLPSLSSIYRYRHNHNISTQEGELNFQGLKTYLESRNLPNTVWVSEDATRISAKIEYDPATNKITGFVMPLKDGMPDNNAFLAKNSEIIQHYFQENRRSDYAYAVMAQPLHPTAPAFCLMVFGTDNRFTSKDVTLRWRKMITEASTFGINILGFSSDGDTRLLKSMKDESHFSSFPPQAIYKWCHVDLFKKQTCFMQDGVHILTKLRTRFLKPKILLPIGIYEAKVDHLLNLIESISKDKHFLTKSDLYPEDKMNYESARKICDEKVSRLLETVPESNGTTIYLKIMNYLIAALIDQTTNLETRIYKIWYSIFICRFWRHWIKHNSPYSLKDNFLTLNTYTCIELNGHMLLKLVIMFQSDKDLTCDMFCPSIFNSQPCEGLFRSARSITSTFSTVINFSIKDFLNRIDRISFINFVVNDLKQSYVFPREHKRETRTNFHKISDQELHNITIEETVNKAMEDAFIDITKLGIVVDKDVGNLLDLKIENLPGNIICEENQEEVEIDSENVTLESTEKEVNQETMDIFKSFLKNDLELHKMENKFENIEGLDLKDYTSSTVDLSEASPYVKIVLSKTKSVVVKKSSFCWLLNDGNGKVSNDRLKRFMCSKRKIGNDDSSASSANQTPKKIKKYKNPSKKPNQNSKQNSDRDSDLSSDDDNDELVYDDSSDTESFSSLTGSTIRDSSKEEDIYQISIETEKYYAVLYYEAWYIGRVIQKEKNQYFTLKFLKKDLDAYVWPKNSDIAKVHSRYIFYGPIELLGSGPFQIKRLDCLNINKKYRELKKQK